MMEVEDIEQYAHHGNDADVEAVVAEAADDKRDPDVTEVLVEPVEESGGQLAERGDLGDDGTEALSNL